MYTNYFMCLIFVSKGHRRNILTAKISQSTVLDTVPERDCLLWTEAQLEYKQKQDI